MITVKRYVPAYVELNEEDTKPVEVNTPLEILRIPFIARYLAESYSLSVKTYPEGDRVYLMARLTGDANSHIVASIDGVSLADMSTVILVESPTFDERAKRNVIAPVLINVLDDTHKSGVIFLFLQQHWDEKDRKFKHALELLKNVIEDTEVYQGYGIIDIFDLEVHLKTGSKYNLEVSATVQGVKIMGHLEFQQRVTVNFLKG